MRLPLLAAGWLLPAALSAQAPAPASSAWLALLPGGVTKRQFIVDCTNCHQFDSVVALPEGRERTRDEWAAAVRKMLEYAGSTTSFPIISAGRDPDSTAAWLVAALAGRRPVPVTPPRLGRAEVTEYPMPLATDLPHDLALDPSGQVIITGMFSHVLYRLDPQRGTLTPVALPVPKAGPRAIEVDTQGDWWVLLGGAGLLGRYTPASGRWSTWPLGMYPHSVALDADGAAWFNGHFTRFPEQIGRVNPASGRVETFDLPPHPRLARTPGGPIPYELRAGSDGTIWGSELQGNRIFAFHPATRRTRVWDLPTPMSAPRRFDIGPGGTLWIPGYASNKLIRFEPTGQRFSEFPLPVPDALPYVVRVDAARNAIWIGTAGADLVFRFDPHTEDFTAYQLPSAGALVRHLAIDPTSGDVWLAYGASPSRISARVARLRPR